MSTGIQATPIGASPQTVNYEGWPDICPVCHHSAYPSAFGIQGLLPDPSHPGQFALQLVFRCPRQRCGTFFIGQYALNPVTRIFSLEKLLPRTAQPAPIDQAVANLSPDFVRIYNQAVAAEAAGLDEITGVGLRKALEFVIKDYCIFKNPTQADDIKKSFLGTCIKAYVPDANVKKCAERATWLGNDETHYVRVWDSHDLSDLKALIKLTVNWIANELLTAQYFAEMQGKQTPEPPNPPPTDM